MAGPINHTTLEGQILDRHFIELQAKADRAQSAFVLLNNYNWNGIGVMPSFVWTAPNGNNFEYNNGYGEIYYKGTGYSGLGSEGKREFFQYLTKFIFECLKNYDINYNL